MSLQEGKGMMRDGCGMMEGEMVGNRWGSGGEVGWTVGERHKERKGKNTSVVKML